MSITANLFTKIVGFLLIGVLLLSWNIRGVSAGIPLAPKTPTQTPTQTLTRTNTSTSTPITYTVTASATPGPGMQLTTLTPNVETGLYSSYTLDSSPAIGLGTNDLYVWMTVSGTTAPTGDFSRATFIPAIQNNRSTTFTFYWSAYFRVTGFPDVVYAHFGWDHEFSGSYLVSGSGSISPNGTWRPDIGIVQKNLASCGGCPYTLYTTIHFSEKDPYASPFTSTPLPSATVTPTYTVTPSATIFLTPTMTMTPTASLTPFTALPTNTPPPNSGGSGICWESKSSWAGYTVDYTIDRNTIPTSLGWDSSINSAAQTWNNVTPSHFIFGNTTESNNIIYYEEPSDPFYLAEAGPQHLTSLFYITEKWMRINPNYSWDTNNIPDLSNPDSNGSTTTYNVQNVVTHELGHWLQLEDIYDQNCSHVTMHGSAALGEINKITLDAADQEAINWQYP